jgi:hypothetical protein
MQVHQWASYDFVISGRFQGATFLLHHIDPNVTVVTNISVAWTGDAADRTASFANIDSITFSDGTVQTLNLPSYMGPQPSNIVNILYKIEVNDCQGRATLFFLGLI